MYTKIIITSLQKNRLLTMVIYELIPTIPMKTLYGVHIKAQHSPVVRCEMVSRAVKGKEREHLGEGALAAGDAGVNQIGGIKDKSNRERLSQSS